MHLLSVAPATNDVRARPTDQTIRGEHDRRIHRRATSANRAGNRNHRSLSPSAYNRRKRRLSRITPTLPLHRRTIAVPSPPCLAPVGDANTVAGTVTLPAIRHPLQQTSRRQRHHSNHSRRYGPQRHLLHNPPHRNSRASKSNRERNNAAHSLCAIWCTCRTFPTSALRLSSGSNE